MPFDARAAKLLQAGEHLLILPEHPGLRLEATAMKRSWIYRYKSPVDDGMRQIKIGAWPKMGYPDAAVEWAALRDQRDAGHDPQLEKKTARRKAVELASAERAGPYLVKHLVEDYLSGHIDKHRKPKGRAEVRRVLERAIGPLADRPADLLLRKEAFDLIQSLKDTPVIAAQVRQELGAAWDHGLDSGRINENTPNWWRQILRGKLRSKGKTIAGVHVGTAKRVLNEVEIAQLLEFMPNFSTLIQDALTMYLWTGTRGGEIMAMQAHEIATESDVWWWTIPKAKTKNLHRENATDLRVPLVGRAKLVVRRRLNLARAVLREDPESPGYLFAAPSRLGYTEQKTIQSSLYQYQPYARVPKGKNAPPRLPVTHWGPHDLRRTVRTRLAAMGCPKDVAESVLGHMLQGIEGVYNLHHYDDERLEWLTRLDAKLEQLAQQPSAAAS